MHILRVNQQMPQEFQLDELDKGEIKIMELKLEDIKATLIRLQGQIDVWQGLYQEVEREQAKKNEPTTESK